jgi:hypothetical protein
MSDQGKKGKIKLVCNVFKQDKFQSKVLEGPPARWTLEIDS